MADSTQSETPTPPTSFHNNVHIHFKDVTVTTHVPSDDSQSGKILFSPLIDLGKSIKTCGKNTKPFHRVQGISGVIKPGSMTLVLAGPGAGSSTFLRTLSNRLACDNPASIRYNGKTSATLEQENVDIRKVLHYIDQVDNHLGLLTVQETLNFCQNVNCVETDAARVDHVINSLGLRECRDTYVGDALVRGISGGQRRRVSISQALLSDSSVLALDLYSNGLDASTAFDITKILKEWTTETNGSVIATLTQPTPEIYSQFDQLILLADGKCVYNGPTCDIQPFINAMGYIQPHDVDLCDYLVNILLNPQSVLISQRQYLRSQKDNDKVKAFLQLQKKKTGKAPAMISTSMGNLTCLPTPSITTDEMFEFYQTSPQYKAIIAELATVFPHTTDDEGESTSAGPAHKISSITPTEVSKKRFAVGPRHNPLTLLSLLLFRESRIALRSLNTTIPRLCQAIILGLLYGGVYWLISDDDFFRRISIILVSLTQVGFNSTIEVPILFQSNFTINNQIASSYYPSWAFVLASFLNSIPQVIVECILFVVITYFMTGAALYPQAFFVFLAIVVLQSIQMGALFRLLTSVSGSLESANTLTQTVISFGIVFGGFFLTYSNVPSWLIWLYWGFSSFSWTTRALAINEYKQAKYDQILTVPINIFDPTEGFVDVRRGDLFLEYADMRSSPAWILYAAIFLIGTTLISILLHSYVLSRRRKSYELSRGTRRIVDYDALKSAKSQLLQQTTMDQNGGAVTSETDDNNNEKELNSMKQRIIHDAQISSINECSRKGTLNQEQSSQLRSQVTGTTQNQNCETTNRTEPLHTLQTILPVTPTWLSFHDLKYTVQVKDTENGGMKDRVLLNGINGYAEPGVVLALMGASGAGKTTLLDVLAGLKTTGCVEGDLLINGRPATKALLSLSTGYVEQFHSLHPYQTVYETFLFAARLRLPADIDDATKHQVVEEIIDVLELDSIRNQIIGNHKYPSLSPSQCKLVSIGVELVANPAVIFLDEPTTGIDSASAKSLMSVVKKLASTRAVIVCLHQPSADVFYLFDRIVLLAPGGNQIFYGDLGERCNSFIKYFNTCPKISQFQSGNPATWLIESTVQICHNKDEEEEYHGFLDKLSQYFFASKHYQYLLQRLALLKQIRVEITTGDLQNTSQTIRQSTLPSNTGTNNNGTAIAPVNSIDASSPDNSGELYKTAVDSSDLQIHVSLGNQGEINDSQLGYETNHVTHGVERNGVELTSTNVHNTDNQNTEFSVSLTIARNQKQIPTTTKSIDFSSRPNIMQQFILLFLRNHSSYWRDPLFLFNRLVTCLGLSIIFGLIYQSVKPVDQSGVLSLISAACVVVYFASTVHCSSLPAFETRTTFYREKAAGFYLSGLWSLSSLLNELIWIIPAAILTGLPNYWIVGFPPNTAQFFLYLLTCYLCIVSYISTTIAISACTPNSSLATLLSSAYLGLSFLYSGLTITLPQLAIGWHWLVHLFPLSHAIHALIQLFEDYDQMIIVLDASNQPVLISVADFIAQYLDMAYGRTWTHLGWLLLYIVALQVVAFLGTIFFNWQKR